MIYKVSDNIISVLGFSSSENYQAVKEGKTGLRCYEQGFGLPEMFVASLLDEEKLNDAFFDLPQTTKIKYTKLEKAAILSIYQALAHTDINPSDDEVLYVFSTTKGNIELLDENNNDYEHQRVYLWRSAQLIAEYFGNRNQPLVVSNACISGVSAQIAAVRYLMAGRYKYAIVTGAEMLSKFIISGFQSFKALSKQICKPFDKYRTGLNLGEAAATIIYASAEQDIIHKDTLIYENGAVCNDANHISGPSRTGEGLFNAITKTIKGMNKNDISFINAHGTATPYNDDMESVAIGRAELENIPVNSLKAYFGHTLGAAGILETIISAEALQDNVILKSLGCDELGVAASLCVNRNVTASCKNKFLKLMSGFGGSNAAIVLSKYISQNV
ncbi:MAG: beta-ketoacyl synthase [Bacteroidales bacterium]|jgi:3-oxoacyl-[acyl-carrier-protein] synthase-1|nr:beta-ketoacyl synthase [Bacteroidales bacterium]